MRVENVKGAVWTVDEMEFYKRRPQRLQERLPSSSASLTGSTNERNSMEMLLDNDVRVHERNINGVNDIDHRREVDLREQLTRDLVSEMRDSFPVSLEEKALISRFSNNTPSMNHTNLPAYHVSRSSRTPSRSSSRSRSRSPVISPRSSPQEERLVSSRSPSPQTTEEDHLHSHLRGLHHQIEERDDNDDHKEKQELKLEA
jgi:hypothetical protein